jgi:hypothetical protein
MAKAKTDPLIKALVEVKAFAMEQLPKRAATFRALDVASKIAGWELAAELKGETIPAKQVREIYLEAAGD